MDTRFYRSPCCTASLVEQPDKFICEKCGATYPIKEGIPMLIPGAAQNPSEN